MIHNFQIYKEQKFEFLSPVQIWKVLPGDSHLMDTSYLRIPLSGFLLVISYIIDLKLNVLFFLAVSIHRI